MKKVELQPVCSARSPLMVPGSASKGFAAPMSFLADFTTPSLSHTLQEWQADTALRHVGIREDRSSVVFCKLESVPQYSCDSLQSECVLTSASLQFFKVSAARAHCIRGASEEHTTGECRAARQGGFT